jgi:hypothetical protein
LSRWVIALALAVLAGSTLTACQSSQDKAREIQARAQAAAPKPLVIRHPDKDVKVTGTTLLHSENGDAIVVELKNESRQTLVNVPILVDVRDTKGRTVYKNDTAGIDFALNHIAVLKPGQTFDWVNDQVTGQGKSAKVVVGQPEGNAPPGGQLPELAVSPPKLGHDFSGAKVTGTVTDSSKLDQSHLILFAVSRSGGRIVAAGRGQIKALKVKAKPAPYVIFFIGNPTGDVTIEAPPTVLR